MKKSRLDDMIINLEGLERLNRPSIEAFQLKRLNELLIKEKKRGGFYGNLPEKLSSLEEFQTLPFTVPGDLEQYGSRMLLCSQSEVQKIITDRTSGTTGNPKRLFYTAADLEHTVLLFVAGLGEFIYPGSRTLICMPFSGPYGLGELIAEAVARLGAVPLAAGPFLTYGEYARIMEKEQPDTYVGMPAQLLSILRFCGQGSLKRALISGDACPDTVVKQCEKLLGIKLFPHYGSREMALGGAVTCPAHEGMHLRENHVIAEIIDNQGQVLPRGQYGELVITTIGMEAQPLIRYRTGDYTRILDGECPCKSEVLRLDTIRRKTNDFLPDIWDLDNLLFAFENVVDYHVSCLGYGTSCPQAHAACRGLLNIRLLVLKECNTEVIRDKLTEKYRDWKVTVTSEKCKDTSSSLYFGKRSIKMQPISE